jgi:hypothetical protein
MQRITRVAAAVAAALLVGGLAAVSIKRNDASRSPVAAPNVAAGRAMIADRNAQFAIAIPANWRNGAQPDGFRRWGNA